VTARGLCVCCVIANIMRVFVFVVCYVTDMFLCVFVLVCVV
jgi:hypothetical protein